MSRAAWAALACALAACSSTATQTIVVIDADATVRARTRTLEIEIRDAAGEIVRQAQLSPGTSDPAIPFTIALEPAGGDASRTFEVRATASDDSGARITEAEVRSGYRAGERLELRMYLEVACANVTCDADQACRRGACVPSFVDPATLPDYPAGEVDAGQPIDSGAADAGARDAATDGGADAGGMDGGSPDAGPPDAGPPPLEPGLLLHGGSTGATVTALFVAADATQVCAGGEVSGGAVTIEGVTLPASAMPDAWVACFDLDATGAHVRYVRRVSSSDVVWIRSIMLDSAGNLLVAGPIPTSGARTFDGHTITANAYVVRIDRAGTVTDATTLSEETMYPTFMVERGSSLYLTNIDVYGNSGSVALVDLTTFTHVESRYVTSGGWHYQLSVLDDESAIVVGELEDGPRAVVHRVPAPPFTPTTWTRRSVGRAAAYAIQTLADGTSLVLGMADGPLQWEDDTTVYPGASLQDDVVLTRFDPAGTTEWVTRPIAAPGFDHATFLAAEPGGDLVAGGHSAMLVAPAGLSTLPSEGGSQEGWIMRVSSESGAALAWERIAGTGSLSMSAGVVGPDGWLYAVGSFDGTVRATSSDAFGVSGLAASGTRDAFLVRLPVP